MAGIARALDPAEITAGLQQLPHIGKLSDEEIVARYEIIPRDEISVQVERLRERGAHAALCGFADLLRDSGGHYCAVRWGEGVAALVPLEPGADTPTPSALIAAYREMHRNHPGMLMKHATVAGNA